MQPAWKAGDKIRVVLFEQSSFLMIRPYSINFWQRHPLAFAGLAFMSYAMLASTAIQLVVLPYLLPGLHAGHGLLTGGDFPGLHAIASRKAGEIAHHGWAAWELLPEGQSPAGIASAMYALIRTEPWALIPFNAALHAAGGLVVTQLVRILGGNAPVSFWSGALFVVFPSSMQWVSQIQKDSTFFAGMLAVLLGTIMLIRTASPGKNSLDLIKSAGIIASGMLLIALSRFYGFEFLKVLNLLLLALALPYLFLRWRAGHISAMRLGVVWAILIVIPFIAQISRKDERIPAEMRFANERQITVYDSLGPIDKSISIQRLFSIHEIENVHIVSRLWKRTDFLPEAIDRVFLRLATARYGWQGSSYQTAGSMIDSNTKFWKTLDVIEYFPRALQIGALAPFPEHWVAQGSSPGGTMMRRVVGVEMLFLYPMLLIGLPMAAWRWKRRLEFWMIITFCVPLIILYGCTIPNLGSLYRLRFGFEMTLAAVGFAAIWLSLQEWQTRHKQPSTT